jgi:transcriptional regulator with XRE-family HTH domain
MNNDELKKRRERLGLTQAALAEKIGVVPNTVSRYETGSLEIPAHMSLVLEALEARHIKELQTSIDK